MKIWLEVKNSLSLFKYKQEDREGGHAKQLAETVTEYQVH